jgi:hypothetical protein
MAPLGYDERHLCNSMKTLNPHPTFHFRTCGDFVLCDPLLSPPSRSDSENLVYFLGRLKDLVPNDRRDWRCGNFLPPDPLQPHQNFLSVHVVMGALC